MGSSTLAQKRTPAAPDSSSIYLDYEANEIQCKWSAGAVGQYPAVASIWSHAATSGRAVAMSWEAANDNDSRQR